MSRSITTITGPMYASKSTELQRMLKRAQFAGKRVIMFKPAIDDRYSETDVVTHDGLSFPAHNVSSLDEVWDILLANTGNIDVVGFDEAQFFSPDLINLALEVASDVWHMDVIIAGLDTDFMGRPFETMVPIVFKSDHVVKLTAVCLECGNDATRTQRIVDGKPATHGEVVVVGGLESYEARCRHCFVSVKSTTGVTI